MDDNSRPLSTAEHDQMAAYVRDEVAAGRFQLFSTTTKDEFDTPEIVTLVHEDVVSLWSILKHSHFLAVHAMEWMENDDDDR